MVSGAIIDNAPPGKEIARRVWELNQYYEGKIHFQMVTLEQFFETVEEKKESIPVYRGNWTDWWADGVGSTPAEVKMYKDAVRKYHIFQKLDPDGSLDRQGMLDRAMEEMMMYAEHTWGYPSSRTNRRYTRYAIPIIWISIQRYICTLNFGSMWMGFVFMKISRLRWWTVKAES